MCEGTAAAAAAAAVAIVLTTVVTAVVIVPDEGAGSVGVKDAIQDLYAQIRASEMDGVGGGSSAPRLDRATLAKARYVSERLQRMVSGDGGGGGSGVDGGSGVRGDGGRGVSRGVSSDGDGGVVGAAKTVTAGVGNSANGGDRKLRQNQQREAAADPLGRTSGRRDDDDGGESAARIDRLMSKCVEIALAKDREAPAAKNKSKEKPRAKAKTSSGPPPQAHLDVEALERRFLEVIEQFEKSKKASSTVATSTAGGGGARRRTTTTTTTTSTQPPTVQPSVRSGLFKFPLFNRQRVSYSAAASTSVTIV